MIPMQLNSDVLNRVTYLVGSAGIANELPSVPAKVPFDDNIVRFLNDVSREIREEKTIQMLLRLASGFAGVL